MTQKENYMRFMHGEETAYCPQFDFTWMVGPSVLFKDRNPDMSGFDFYGVEYEVSPESGGGFIPIPGKFLMDDLTKWRDIVKNPDLSDVDWEAMAKKDCEHLDRENNPVVANFIPGFFQCLINFMGFTEGLCAIFEEPEEAKAMMEYITDFYVMVAEKMIDYYKPDMMWLPDDVCTERAPFISKESYDEIFMPSIKRYARAFIDRGIPVQIHCCGQCMDLIEGWVDIGITGWDPAQLSNDIVAIKKKYGNKLAINGAWDSSGPVARLDVTEEMLREEVRKWCDTYLPLGGMGFMGGVIGDFSDPVILQKNGWIQDEFKSYSQKFFSKTNA
ncbi:Uroporphyrinogen decarboxylase (URO-D) [Acetitomaculum ruminis DSM 5522]|uniref:Uroporphyrinogen decarboxylase (URO-D) n=1 Tax=Acetitomaculum ruminis DSM 5522 TaxID=1120918 RepID=A0A1I0YN31_9FIRM|nr:uroporphyrinogen decarboxylase family protein [Acetitomaculum ruminis]SFB13533.1 Uroporphyrinogen decarboxylase (URO-D) [Acetitomaculum ruminis DSM 5522]